jgi:hypothetical protein
VDGNNQPCRRRRRRRRTSCVLRSLLVPRSGHAGAAIMTMQPILPRNDPHGLAELFARVDEDGSGTLEREEIATMSKELGEGMTSTAAPAPPAAPWLHAPAPTTPAPSWHGGVAALRGLRHASPAWGPANNLGWCGCIARCVCRSTTDGAGARRGDGEHGRGWVGRHRHR